RSLREKLQGERATSDLISGNPGLANTELLFRVSGLCVDYDAAGGDVVHALRAVDLDVAPGQTVGVLGESGSGKSSLALAMMRLLPRNARVFEGSIPDRGRTLAELNRRQRREMRGAAVALISQEPALALNPVLPLGMQMVDVLKAHTALDASQLAAAAQAMLRDVGFPEPERIMRAYPHQLSGGQRQRVAIAPALVCRPQLLIADEPLSSLDAAAQAEIVDLLLRLRSELNLAMLFVTHNAGVLSSLADHIIVMREGEIAARGRMDELERSSDAYVQGVLFPERNLLPASRDAKPFPGASPLLEVSQVNKKFVQRRMLSRRK